MTNYSDIDLLEGVNERSPRIYKPLHARYFRSLYMASVKYTENSLESEDIVNNLFVQFFIHYKEPKFPTLNQVYYYLLRAVKNASINYTRSPANPKKAFPLQEEYHSDDCIELAWDAIELKYREELHDLRLQKTTKLLHSLPQVSIEVLKLIYFTKLSTKEIAAKLSIQPQTVLNHKAKGLALLAKILLEDQCLVQTVLILLLLSNF